MKAHIWSLVHAERHALIADLEQVRAVDFDIASLCPGWSVHDVAAHLVNNAKVTALGLVAAMAKARFDFDRQNAQGVAKERGATPDVTLHRLREVADRTSGPPVDVKSRLVEEIVHGEDIRRPLGLARSYPAEAVAAAIEYQVATKDSIGGSQQRVDGLALRATDTDFRSGTGEEVAGPAASLLLAICGRTAALDDLSGPGADQLRARIA